MALRPHIVHVVGHSEAHHAATAEDVIESCLLARRAIQNALRGMPDMTCDPQVQARCAALVAEAQATLAAIDSLAAPGCTDPLTDPTVLGRAVRLGILDAPQLRNNPIAPGRARTRMMAGACVAVDSQDRPLSEPERLQQFSKEAQ
jgi:hypothetical protein